MHNEFPKAYRIAPIAIPAMVSKAIAWRVISFVVVFGGIRLLQYYVYHIEWSDKVMLISSGLILLVLIVSYIRLAIRLKKQFLLYELIVDKDAVSCKNALMNDITLPYDNITQVVRYGGGNLLVYGLEQSERILINHNIEGFHEVTALLESIVPQGISKPKWSGYFSTYRSIFTLLLSVGYILSKNVALSIGCGVAFVAYLAWTMQDVKNSNYNSSSKQASLIVTGIVLFFISASLLLKIYRIARLYLSF